MSLYDNNNLTSTGSDDVVTKMLTKNDVLTIPQSVDVTCTHLILTETKVLYEHCYCWQAYLYIADFTKTGVENINLQAITAQQYE